MRADYLSFKRATNRSLVGLAIQLVLGLALLLYGFFGKDHAARTASIYVLTGVPVWLILAVLYDQHRRERIEAIEAEAFAATDAATSSVFEQQEEDLRVNAKRLKMMYRVLVPVASLAVGALLVGLGVWRFKSAEAAFAGFAPSALRGWGIAVGLGVAFVGFLFARYISGMAKQKEWANLRAGAGYAVGSALLGLSLAVANFVGMVGGPKEIAQYLVYVFPVAVVVLGVEVFLNFVLDIYRPRRPGEYPRPAFESRVLGFVAAPDRIAESIGEALNYQFGYDVSSSWFYRLLSRSALRVLVPVAAAVLLAMSSVVVIRPHEEGMVLRWGQLARTIGPGLHLKWPWPVEKVEVPLYTVRNAKGKVEYSARTVSGVRVLDIGTPPPPGDKPILWTNEHTMQETFFLVQPDPVVSIGGAQESSQAVRGRDLAMVAAEVPLHYAIDDLEAYERLAAPDMRDAVLKNAAQRAVMQYFTGLTAGDLLSGDRDALRGEVRARIERAFTELNPLHNGRPVVKVLFVGLQGLHPPAANETAVMFEKVVAAQQRYTAQLRDAEATEIKLLTTAAGSVDQARRIVKELDTLDTIPSVVENQPNPAYTEQQLRVRALIQDAGGKAADLILTAAADRWKAHMGAKTSLTRYQGQLGMYLANPALFRATRYLEGLKDMISESRVYIADPRIHLTVRPNLQDPDTSVGDIFATQNQD